MILDTLFMEFVHWLCVRFGSVLTPFLMLISMLGEKAWFFLLIAAILFLNKKTRWIGTTIIISIFIGWIAADFIFKPLFMRMRPYTESNLYQDYWMLAGAHPETDYSMPSGHTLGAAAFFISLYITSKKDIRKNILIVGIIVVLLMTVSRTYFMHHYLSDCVVGIVFAFLTSFIAKSVVKNIYNFIKNNQNIPLFNSILNFSVFSQSND